ncbi:aspartate aminotransferase family protein [Planctomicrobium piriforme]|uniref:Acetylornithine aminotransferase n=1 Tax=Planctomicrobium piriforme TaxID=1576369 RepID=A0A1I3NAW4_9PLAN|nr:aspartate aminotransferase family protein [Planctomicrobium piriforme]SFJ06285.1 transaminase, acetylornithine/succinylornithine family [Planctomicrobium piriforme]
MTTTRSSADTIALFEKYVIPNYRRYPISLVKGEGSRVWDAEGNQYLDLFPGWGCNILGYSPQRVIDAVRDQVGRLIHVPNTWHTEPQGEFAEALCTRGFGKAFFCNSGAEAIEGAIKLARLHTPKEKYKILTFYNGFHGRTFAAVTATAQPKYHEGFGPLVPGFEYAPHNDLEAVRKLVDDETAAILIEPVQGEGGVNVPAPGFLAGLREICDERNMLLIFDEVQTGMGRTGNWFGYQTFGVQPDIMTMAKGIAAGVACGAFICRDEIAPSLRPGIHASTFGGNPLAMTAGLATVQTIEEEGLLEHCLAMSARFQKYFEQLQSELPIIRQVRVCGMMIGIDLAIDAVPAVKKCLDRGLLINATHDTVVRLLPALNVTEEDVDQGCETLGSVLREMAE